MSLFAELKRRNVFRVGIAWILMGWVVLQGADFVLDLVGAPDWVIRAMAVFGVAGLPVALFFAWAFEVTPEGIKREADVDRSQSIAPTTGRKLDRAIIVFLALAVVLLLTERFLYSGQPDQATEVAAVQENTATTADEQPVAEMPRPNSIAVLPFANRSTQENDLFFSDGIHDDLLTQLAKIDDLKVISRTSVMEYRNTTRKIPEIAAELGVARILEGGVQRAGNRVRINAQLIDVATDEHLWAETFDREMTIDNIFDIQTEITRQIVSAIRGELSAREQQLISARPTDNLEAWEAYQHMQAILRRPEYSLQKYLEAEPWARKAVELDPEFAAAWAKLSEIQAQGVWTGWINTPEQRDSVRTSLQKAVALAPDDPLVILARADYQYRIEVDYPGALELIKKAQALMPGDALVLGARALTERRLGLWEQSIASYERALALDPLNGFMAATMMETLRIMNEWTRLEYHADRWLQRVPDSAAILGLKADALLLGHGDLAGARAILDAGTRGNDNISAFSRMRQAMFERDWDHYIALATDPDISSARVAIFSNPALEAGMGYYFKGEQETARSYLQAHIRDTEVVPGEGIIAGAYKLWSLSTAHALLGEHELARRYMREARAMLPTEKDHIFGPNIERGEIWLQAWTGERDQALERIEQLLEQYRGFTRWELYLDPRWDFFRDDDRFNALIRPANAPARPATVLQSGDGA